MKKWFLGSVLTVIGLLASCGTVNSNAGSGPAAVNAYGEAIDPASVKNTPRNATLQAQAVGKLVWNPQSDSILTSRGISCGYTMPNGQDDCPYWTGILQRLQLQRAGPAWWSNDWVWWRIGYNPTASEIQQARNYYNYAPNVTKNFPQQWLNDPAWVKPLYAAYLFDSAFPATQNGFFHYDFQTYLCDPAATTGYYCNTAPGNIPSQR